jgi:adenine-specific DNA-methyltransferase
MARRNQQQETLAVSLRHESVERSRIPTAVDAATGNGKRTKKPEKAKYSYNPHLPPILRFDPDGSADKIKELVEKAIAGEKLTEKEADALRAIAANFEQPWQEWSAKKEQADSRFFDVDPVALHIHERISTEAIIRTAKREDVQKSLFAEDGETAQGNVQTLEHMNWANRLILGDSLAVMASLSRREGLAGRIQMIYVDPPYGVSYDSNFQPEVGRTTVTAKQEDLTREPEMVKAYRDTWTLGIHSYLSYLRNRLLIAKELLANSGSIFVQISDEHLHKVRAILDEVFGPRNFCSLITFRKKTMPMGADVTEAVSDYLLWYACDRSSMKVRSLFKNKDTQGDASWSGIEFEDGFRRRLRKEEIEDSSQIPDSAKIFQPISLLPAQYRPKQDYVVDFEGRKVPPPKRSCWKTDRMDRVVRAGRAWPSGDTLRYVLFHDDYRVAELTNLWSDTSGATNKGYVVQTSELVIERCMLLTTDPGDLVLDPTCGGGTTAFVAEQWGRRWITMDCSRVSIAVARQRLLAERFESYRLRPVNAEDVRRNPRGTWLSDPTGKVQGNCTFDCVTVPHITMGSIAQNPALDPVFEKWDPLLEEACLAANAQLDKVPPDLRSTLRSKAKASLGDKKAISVGNDLSELRKALSDADWRRWILPPDLTPTRSYTTVENGFSGWYEWEMPFDVDTDWPQPLQDAVNKYRKLWKSKMKEVSDCIAASAESEELVDRPYKDNSAVRVSGPFSVEGMRPAELSLDEYGQLSLTIGSGDSDGYLDTLTSLLRADGVTYLNNRRESFSDVRRDDGTASLIHAIAIPKSELEETLDVLAVSFGPQSGPFTLEQAEAAISDCKAAGHSRLLLAGFSFDAEVSDACARAETSLFHVEMAHIRPDASPSMDGLLKTTSSSQIFSVFGQPEVEITKSGDGWIIELLGVDIYSPVNATVESERGDKVAAWFLDADYDGRCFCVTQAFFPRQDAWEKIAKALGSAADPEAFAAFAGTRSLRFRAGEHRRIAVKVIDPRGNEVMVVKNLEGN